MKRIFSIVAFGAALLGTTAAHAADPVTVAERALILEMDLWGGYLWRDGNAIGDDEVDDFPLFGGGALAGIPLGESGLLQIEFDGEGSFYGDNGDVDDTYAGSLTTGAHLAWINESYLLGIFGGVGKTFNVDDDDEDDQNATHYFAGLEGKMNFDMASLALQGGYIGSDSDDAEHFDDALFVRGIGQIFFNDGRTMLQGDVAYANGTQDYDASSADQDDLDLYAWGAELEHAPDMDIGGGALSLFAAYEGLHLVENEKLTDHTVRIGFKIRFGATTPQEREMATAPDLPNVGRWLGATPAVD